MGWIYGLFDSKDKFLNIVPLGLYNLAIKLNLSFPFSFLILVVDCLKFIIWS